MGIVIRTVSSSTLRFHQAIHLIPEMRTNEYADLKQDIRERGIITPLDVDGHIVLDGRHRLTIAGELGIEQVLVRDVLLNGNSQVDYMLKSAVLRRHLTDHQRAMMAAMYAKENPKPLAKVAGPGRGHKKTAAPTGARSFSESHPAQAEAARTMNVSVKAVDRAARVLSADPKLAEEVHQGRKKLGQATREIDHSKKVERAKLLEFPRGQFGVIVVDPPWPYSRKFGRAVNVQEPDVRGQGDDRRAISPYPEMTMEELKTIKLPAAKDCILWLWVTNNFMREAFDLLDAWGFQEKTMLTWIKSNIGLGDWLRGQTEHCVLAVKGKPIVTLKNQSTALYAKAGKHSEKPAEFFTLVESLCPSPQRCELYATRERDGWTVYGSDVAE